MKFVRDLNLAMRIARRDMRGGVRALGVLLAGVLVGAAAVALVGASTQTLIDGARRGALEAVGGDISLRLFHTPPSEVQQSFLRGQGRVSIAAELRPMARVERAEDGSASAAHLVELKGVDMAYPLYGEVDMRPRFGLYQTLNRQGGVYGAVADQALFEELDAELGDALNIGEATYQLRGVLHGEPDRAFRAFSLGPRVMVLRESLPVTGVVTPGADVYYYTRLRLPKAQANAKGSASVLNAIDQAFPEAGWRMVNAHDGVPGVERTLAMAHVLLLFIAMGVMLIGGAGISGAVRAHIAVKMEIIAILKSIGTPPRVVTMALLCQVLAIAGLGAALGVGVGAWGPWAAVNVLGDTVPFDLSAIPVFKPLIAAWLFGVLVAALFAWWPLMGVQRIGARILLRERQADVSHRVTISALAGSGLLAVAIAGVVLWVSPMGAVTLAFLAGALALAGGYYALGLGMARLARLVARGRGSTVRLALANLYRGGAPTGAVVMALGLTLTLLVALDVLGGSAARHVRETVPQRAPDLVAFSLPPETARRMARDLTDTNIAKKARMMPFVHARVQAIKGRPVRELDIPRSLAWVVRGDRGVSYVRDRPDGVVEGTWWNGVEARGTAFSLDAEVARKLGLGIGDDITLNVMGQSVTGPIQNLRSIDWTGLDLDFPILTTPGALEETPHTFAAALTAWPGGGADLEDYIRRHYPEVPLIRVDDVLMAFARALDAVVTGLQAAAWMCGLAALVVLAGSVMQGLQQRLDEAVLFKVLGARRRQLLGLLALEFAILGTLVACVAMPLGLGVAMAVARAAKLTDAVFDLAGPIGLAGGAVALTVGVGMVVTAGAYAVTPSRVLRNRGL